MVHTFENDETIQKFTSPNNPSSVLPNVLTLVLFIKKRVGFCLIYINLLHVQLSFGKKLQVLIYRKLKMALRYNVQYEVLNNISQRD